MSDSSEVSLQFGALVMLKNLISLALVAVPASAFAETPIAGIDGAWESLSCEVRPQVGQDGAITEWWLTRALSFDDGVITADFTTYAGPGCTNPLNVLSFQGDVTVIGDSNLAQGAKEADLVIDSYVRITALAQGFADFLNQSGEGDCGAGAWTVGESKDILETGCSFLGVAPNTPTIEYEILYVDGDRLFFGARPVDGTFLTTPDDRPKALLIPLARSEG
ncbi:MAG: hypothetical protein AAGO57_04170 [Pseudomonadota bacterium]